MSPRFFGIVSAFWVFPACRGGEADALSREAVRITSAIRSLREAPNAEKAPLLEALAKTNCTAAELCALRATCVEGYRRHTRALTSLAQARRALGADGGAEDAQRLLSQAESELIAAREQVGRCTRDEGQVRRKYGL